MRTPILDAHIDLSDNILYARKNFFAKGGWRDANLSTGFKHAILNQVDLARLTLSEVKIFFGSICPFMLTPAGIRAPKDFLKETLRHIETYYDVAQKSNGKVIILRTKHDLESVLSSQKIGVLLHLEGLYFVKSRKDIFLLDTLYSLGVRSIGPFWERDSTLGTGGRARESRKGLSPLGKSVIKEAIRKKFIIDLTHASNQSIKDIIPLKPEFLTFSHGASVVLAPGSRGLTDNQIKEITKANGIIGVNFLAKSAGKSKSIQMIARQTKYLVEVGGVNHVGIGSDFDGMSKEDIIPGLEDVAKTKELRRELSKEGLRTEEIKKILFSNFLQIIEGVLANKR